MQKINMNKNWEFAFEQDLGAFNDFGFAKYAEAAGAPARFYRNNNWQKIDLPHDWAVALPKDLTRNTMAGGRANSRYNRFMSHRYVHDQQAFHIGWYRKTFCLEKDWQGKRIFLEFEGIFRDAALWINGVYIDRHLSGYTGFLREITDHLVEGENSIAVRVDSDQAEGWFYEGSGIYRNVYLLIGQPVYFKPEHTVVKAAVDGRVQASAVLVNDTNQTVQQDVAWQILDKAGAVVATAQTKVEIASYSECTVEAEFEISQPQLWSVDEPNLYTLNIKAWDETSEDFGIRSVYFDPDKGFFLNGQPLKIRGACVHQDLGGVGIALTDNLQHYKIRRLKEMGVNAYRCSHNAPSPVLLKACDELGMLVLDETRMFGTSPEALRQLEALIRRDRNHPCVFAWCIGNEEFSVQDLPWSGKLVEKVTRIVKGLDDTRPVVYGGNNGDTPVGANGASEIRGINYIRNCSSEAPGDGCVWPVDSQWVERYHAEHPNQPILGTEESSCVLNRGDARNEMGSGLLDDTGDVTMPWGSTPKGWVKFFEERDYLAGGFMWTGFDYHGEPNPFIYANVSSSFGIIDLCGIEKAPFYYYKAWWGKEPVLKLASHWDHQEGQTVSVRAYTNCQQVTLYVNGKSVETKQVERFDTPVWEIPFEAGVVEAVGIKDGAEYRDRMVTPGKTVNLRCETALKAETEDDIAIVHLEAVDENGTLCPLVNREVLLTAPAGSIVGVCNGDPANLDYEQKPACVEEKFLRLFHTELGTVSVPDLAGNTVVRRYDWLEREEMVDGYCDDYRIIAKYQKNRTPANTYTYTTTVSDAERFAYIEFGCFSGAAQVYLNGVEIGNNHSQWVGEDNTERPYRFYCDFLPGDNELKVVVTTQQSRERAFSGYVKLGREKNEPWTVRLYGGMARVFVKAGFEDQVNAQLLP